MEFDMRAMLEEAELPIEFWDEAAEADCYMRNHVATGPMIDGEKSCPLKAFTGQTPSIDHIRKWGSKCFYYVDKKSVPAGERHDKLVNPGRVGVFMGYSEHTTKHFKVYSPERGCTIMSSRTVVKESAKGGSVDLRLQGSRLEMWHRTGDLEADREKPLTETQSLEEINVDTPTVETPSTAPTAEMPTALAEGATPDDEPMDDLQNCQGDHVEHRQETQQEEATRTVPASEPPTYFTKTSHV
ncbi:uncharacterized protein CPUR_06375 [Claviceps purpurea 20.1]|uniref:Uncharacterized protein n=1 Tax=Claviceps purpurea (strain 20.1) TaxID=1111077 RepID=M1W9L1_CLAP2|nr:uncharacterized protein CPUR_06375 [Claviceps purpurea 20.1]